MLMVNQLIGFWVGGEEALTTLTQVASATSTAETITGPASILAGDLIVLWDVAVGGSTPSAVVPTDFDIIASFATSSTQRSILSYKIAVGSEASASLTGMNGSTNNAKTLYVFRGNVPITVVTPTDAASEGTTGNPAAQTVNASGATTPLVVLGGYGAAGVNARVSPRTFTVGGSAAKDGEINALSDTGVIDADNWLAYKIFNSSPSDVVVDQDDEGNNGLASCYLACA